MFGAKFTQVPLSFQVGNRGNLDWAYSSKGVLKVWPKHFNRLNLGSWWNLHARCPTFYQPGFTGTYESLGINHSWPTSALGSHFILGLLKGVGFSTFGDWEFLTTLFSTLTLVTGVTTFFLPPLNATLSLAHAWYLKVKLPGFRKKRPSLVPRHFKPSGNFQQVWGLTPRVLSRSSSCVFTNTSGVSPCLPPPYYVGGATKQC